MYTTVHQCFAATAVRTPDAEFLFTESVTAEAYGIAPGAIRWGEAAAEVERLRRAYSAAGWGHGHRVGLLLENRPAFLLHWFALNALGASVVPINADMRSAELAYLIGHSEIGLAVTLPERAADLRAAAAQAGVAFQTMQPDDVVPPAGTAPPRPHEAIGLDTECALLYTSGTTGRPKGCILGNAYFLRAGEWYAALDGVCAVRPDAERVITPLPLNHMNAMAFSTMVVLVAGGCLVQLDRFHPKSWLASARESRATIVHYLGVMPAMLLAAPESAADKDHAIRWGFGAGVDRKNHAPFEARFGFPLVEAWAMTETGAGACIMANREPRQVGTSCFGRQQDYVEVRLLDDEGRDVPADTPGELLVRSSGTDPRRYFFSGYLKDEDATREAWAGGWFHTGDLVRRDAEGNFFFVDRKKNVIRRSGENISAVEVESVLNQHPAVKTSAVAATPDAVRGDEVLACIVLRDGVNASERERIAGSIVEHALAQLAYYKAPGYVAFVDALPLTASQKIQRGQLRELAQALPGQPHCVDTRAMKKRQA
ncbi:MULTISPECIES: AMP-binding protein [unclassified Variovorax]|uniref:AMP-binding protein n=1 Tax=unclassified Variovorax TaxID=663243 RepID=UPI00076C0CE2|nr:MULTISPECIES: AMP-binding protein [unclassified Variovorax]KWT98919.1 Long-chain-fatty-acid--CoA ligase [Variovorax sp. WDL1]PNG51869.1 putative crotonobetaine/carnitine-CoA ligase [Variovorax sp. B2]PNG54216.1 putative crotonobetaine/carnitine-CoA ligase [Variovorax sp. B4]VTV11702.1 putative sulfoacetate--CoA ligase [Variovorax sp. WDL1]